MTTKTKKEPGDMSKTSNSLLAEFAKIAFELGLEDALKIAFPRQEDELMQKIGVLKSTKRERCHVENFNRVYLAGFHLGMRKREADAKLR